MGQPMLVDLVELVERLDRIGVRLDLPGKRQQIDQLEQETADPELWQDPQRAQQLLRRLSQLRELVSEWESLSQQARDLVELRALASEDLELANDVEREAVAVAERVRQLELRLLLNGQYDSHDAILAVHAGTGGVDAQDWAEMLLRMYLRWAQRAGFTAEIVDQLEGEEAGIKSVTVEIRGPYAYGYLKGEAGTHRLVRLSPFDAAHRRHTSFALVEVLPLVEEDDDVEIREDEIRIDTFRASGHGGQHVNKTESAVRITHLPTGIVVTCQNERSQLQNRETAMKILKARLLELKIRQRQEEQARLKGKPVVTGWGNRIRSYVLHPYTMVTDHRTEVSTPNIQAVLEGEIDPFIEAYLHQQAAESEETSRATSA
ncbi:MAG: peptide chain release factor 2 [Thermomicrobium sp.]|nr:peptide chain release factor 2 [Thermomicrobium sp.]